MYLKMIYRTPSNEHDTHLLNADHFRWGYRGTWPDEYWLPFPIVDTEQIMVVDVYRDGLTVQSIVVMDAHCYIMGDDGRTIDKFYGSYSTKSAIGVGGTQ